MKTFYFVMLCVISFFVLVFPNGFFGLADDTNREIGSTCKNEENTTVNENILQTLLNSLASNVVDHHGFYQTNAGENSSRIYGSILCRGDISANNCSDCVLNSTRVASNVFPKCRDVTIWFRWCFLRYSNESFFGDMQERTFTYDFDDIDDPSVVSQGLPFMSGVAATASEKSLMFHTEVLNFNQSEKRYGMAQCTRDISRKDCKRCLDSQLIDIRTIRNNRRWEIYGSNCFMWYDDYQFYANVSFLPSGESFDFWLVLFKYKLFLYYNCLSYQFKIHKDTCCLSSTEICTTLNLNISKKYIYLDHI